jgi:PAS domain S-box-containing protein
MDAEASQRFVQSMVPNGMDPAASAAAAAAYGHLGFNGSASAPASRRQSQKNNGDASLVGASADGVWTGMPNAMPDYMQNGAGAHANMSMRAPSNADFRASANGYEPDGPSSNSSEDSAQGKRRRMTFTAAPIQPNQTQNGNKPVLLHNDSGSSMSGINSIGSTPAQLHAPDGQPAHFARPPFRHRRSRSGSEAVGPPGFGQRSFSSIELGSGLQDPYAAGLGYPQPPSLYPAGQQHSHSFNGSQALAAMGGHAASHPPGLGSQILRGVDVSASGSSAATDFTKRKGWTGRVVEELLDFVHVLDPEGTILFASPSVQGLTGWKSEELKGRKLTEFVHPQDVASVEREIDRMRCSKGELLTYYRFKTKTSANRSKKGEKGTNDNESSAGDTGEEKERGNERRSEVEHAEAFTRDGDYIVFEATGHPYFPPEPIAATSDKGGADAPQEQDEAGADNDKVVASNGADADSKAGSVAVKSEKMAPTLSVSSKTGAHPLSQEQTLQTPTSDATSSSRSQLQCFFCSARPYPSKNTSMLDSFLELKLENEKLRLLIADMDLTGPDHDHDRDSFAAAYHPDLLKQELESDSTGGWAHAVNPMFGGAAIGPDGRILPPQSGPRPGEASRQNSIASHPTSPVMRTNSARDEVLAGLGVSAGDESDEDGGASQGVAGMGGADGAANAADEARRKKKPKQDDGDHVCTDCGRVDSPEWRKGPLGPKTLCNACGLRWAKKIKRKGGDPNVAAGAMMVQGGGMPPAGGVPGGVGMNVGMGNHMMPHGHGMAHGHPHPFNRAESGQMQGIQMAPPGSMPPGINMQGMMASSPNGFAARGSFDENPHANQNNMMNSMGGGHM